MGNGEERNKERRHKDGEVRWTERSGREKEREKRIMR